MVIMFQKRVVASILGRGGVGEERGSDCEDEDLGAGGGEAPLSAGVEEESAALALRLTVSPSWVRLAWARSLRLLGDLPSLEAE